MIEMSLAEVAEVVGGLAHGAASVTGAAFVDTRTPEPGGLARCLGTVLDGGLNEHLVHDINAY